MESPTFEYELKDMPIRRNYTWTGDKKRVAVFGSFYRGWHVLKALLEDDVLNSLVTVVGVATDDPSKRFVSPNVRVWRHPHTEEEETMVQRLAMKHDIPVYKGRVKTPEFYDLLCRDWQPDVVYMATFGQLLDDKIIHAVPLGVYNLHPTSDLFSWPSFTGPQPFEKILHYKRAGILQYCCLALHCANERFDDGKLCCFSRRIKIPDFTANESAQGEQIIAMHRLTSPLAGELVKTHLSDLLASAMNELVVMTSSS